MISSQRTFSGTLLPSARISNTNQNSNNNDQNANTQNVNQSNTSYPNTNTNTLQTQTQTNSNRNSLMVPSIDASGMLAAPSRYGVDGSDAISVRSARSGRTIRSMSKYPKDDRTRVPHPSHRHASPSAPWPWVDLGDGKFLFSLSFKLITNMHTHRGGSSTTRNRSATHTSSVHSPPL